MKAATNRDERKLLNRFFSLDALKTNPKEQPNQVDQLILDFHCINLSFCKSKQFSNEKISTLLGIMDFILKTMIGKQLTVERGLDMLKEILSRHDCHRPPFCILIFSKEEVT